jgi:hypothetical protein
MKYYVQFLACVMVSMACGQSAKLQVTVPASQTDTNVIRCIRLMNLSPEFDRQGRMTGFDTNHVYIYWRGNQVQYHISYTMYEEHPGQIPDPADWPSPTKTKQWRKLVATNGERYGAYYDERLGVYNQRMPVDSILKEEQLSGSTMFMHDSTSYNTLLLAEKLSGDTMREIWRYVIKKDTSVYGEIQLYWVPQLLGLPYGIDTAAQHKKGMTLCKLITFFHATFRRNGEVRPYEFTLQKELAEIPVTNAAELLPYFERQRRGQYNVPLKVGGLQ